MSIAIDSIHKLDIFFDAGENVPPPYHYAYHLLLTQKAANLEVEFDLRYLNREELSEEEILAEGFTPNDDWSWRGALPEVWLTALKEQLQKSIWPKKPKERREGEALLELELLSKSGDTLFSGRPADPQSWEYFLQEMMQAIYEMAKKEAPLTLHYKEVVPGAKNIEVWLDASFAQRKAIIKQEGLAAAPSEKELSWPDLKKLLKVVYMPEYDYEQATDAAPKWPGKYISTGEGVWFTFGETILEPGENSNSLERLEQSLKEKFKE